MINVAALRRVRLRNYVFLTNLVAVVVAAAAVREAKLCVCCVSLEIIH